MIEFIRKIIKWFFHAIINHFFRFDHYEYGSLMLSPIDNGEDIFVHTHDDAVKVWFNIEPQLMPYDDYVPVPGDDNYISEAHPCPEGFKFRVNLSQKCRINWISSEIFP